VRIINNIHKNKIIYILIICIFFGIYYYQNNRKILMNDFEQGIYNADLKGIIIESNNKNIILSFNTEETYVSVSKNYNNKENSKKDSLWLNKREFIFCIKTISKILNHNQDIEYLKMPEDSTKFMIKTLVTYNMSALAYERKHKQIWYINIDDFGKDISPDFEKMLFKLIDKKEFYDFFENNK
jgi:hypothetical protein